MADTVPSHPSPPPAQESVKETFESIIIAFVLAFVFRAYVVEAFVIPTGSMAPTLMGAHLDVTCDQCGYRFASDVPGHSVVEINGTRQAVQLREDTEVVCPMCRFANPLRRETHPASGDRILVQKYIYQVTEPRRYDVVVFKAPHEPQRNYIKRLIGLPGEAIHIFEGNIYTRPAGSNEPWRIARKTDRPRVQRAVWQPIYDSRFIPRDGGDSALRTADQHWAPPWTPTASPERWELDGRRSYLHRSDQPGTIRFDFDRLGYQTRPRPGAFVSRYPYNQFKASDHNALVDWEPIEEVRLAAVFQPERAGLSARLATTARLDREATETLAATIDADGTVQLTATDSAGQTRDLTAPTHLEPFAAGESRRVELWYVDQEASVWIEGERVLRWRFDPPLTDARDLLARPRADNLPHVSITVAGSPVALHQVQLDRDVHYSIHSNSNHRRVLARGALQREGEPGEPLRLRADEFFCIGDNTPWSHDSRYWDDVDPWVRHRYFDDLDSLDRSADADRVPDFRPGIIPRELMMGRAFFVYYPAPYAWSATAPRYFPNFGDMRFIH
ncbi:MAG: signal peptidase I [Phycisphaeraceae bacterium]